MTKPNEPKDDDTQVLLIERINQHLSFLSMSHTKRSLEEHRAWALQKRPSILELLDHVLGAEVDSKRDKRIERRISTSGLRERKLFEAFDWDFQPTLDRAAMVELSSLDFLERAEDIVITGTPGTGKSHLLKALGLRACERGQSIRFARCVDLLDDLHAGLANGTYPSRLRHWARPKLLIIDDVGLGQLKKHRDEPTAAHTLYNLIDRRHGRTSTAISSNIALSEWGKYLGDAIITRAILDRLVMNAIRFQIDGPSYRQQVAKERAQKRSKKSDSNKKKASRGGKKKQTARPSTKDP